MTGSPPPSSGPDDSDDPDAGPGIDSDTNHGIDPDAGPDRNPGTGSGTDPDPGAESIVAPSPLLALGTFLVGVALDRVVRAPRLPDPWTRLAGVGSFAAGTALFVGALRAMSDAGATPGHGDDAPELLTDGVFAYSRNPIYAGNCLQCLGLSLLYNSLWPVLLSVPLVGYLGRVVDREEAALEAAFGAEFETYRETVRRWF